VTKHTSAIIAAIAGFPLVASAQVLHDNGGLITTPNPACVTGANFASQLQTVGGFPNGWIGWGHQLSATADNRVADDFTITQAQGWTISGIQFFDYQTLATTTASPITAVNLRIWNAKPGSPGAAVIWGDTTTNRLSLTEFTSIYRISGTCTLNRAIFRSTVTVNASFGPGTYWLDWQAVGSAQFSGPWTPSVTLTGLRGKPGANAVQYESIDGLWEDVTDTGPAPDFSSPPVAQDFPFAILGIVNLPPCYANCDQSTTPPVLTANDFQCFLTNYANGTSYANCDQSGGVPALTANDFQCFINNYVGGCS
jgi:hypothetical protein